MPRAPFNLALNASRDTTSLGKLLNSLHLVLSSGTLRTVWPLPRLCAADHNPLSLLVKPVFSPPYWVLLETLMEVLLKSRHLLLSTHHHCNLGGDQVDQVWLPLYKSVMIILNKILVLYVLRNGFWDPSFLQSWPVCRSPDLSCPFEERIDTVLFQSSQTSVNSIWSLKNSVFSENSQRHRVTYLIFSTTTKWFYFLVPKLIQFILKSQTIIHPGFFPITI